MRGLLMPGSAVECEIYPLLMVGLIKVIGDVVAQAPTGSSLVFAQWWNPWIQYILGLHKGLEFSALFWLDGFGCPAGNRDWRIDLSWVSLWWSLFWMNKERRRISTIHLLCPLSFLILPHEGTDYSNFHGSIERNRHPIPIGGEGANPSSYSSD